MSHAKDHMLAAEAKGCQTPLEHSVAALAESTLSLEQALQELRKYCKPEKFQVIVWVSTGNYLLGLRIDGSIWKCTAPSASPLVWTQVFYP